MNLPVLHVGGRYYNANGATREQAEAAFDKLNSTINMVVGAANTIAGKVLYDLVEWMKQDKNLYRLQAKHYVNSALREFKSYERLHYQNFGDRYALFIDYLDCIEDEVMPHVNKFYWSCKAVMDKLKEPKSELFAKIETAVVVAEIACAVYDRVTELAQQESGFDFSPIMRPARLTAPLKWIVELEKLLCHPTTKGQVIDINGDQNCNLAAQIIMRKLTDYDLFNRLSAKALSFHPELRKNLTDEDKKLLDEAMDMNRENE